MNNPDNAETFEDWWLEGKPFHVAGNDLPYIAPCKAAWQHQQNKIDRLKQFIREKQYCTNDYIEPCCMGCGASKEEGEPCEPDCELQKILGEK
jgi:hypothetical protein